MALTDTSGRAFLYNFHTLPGYRGQGLYPTLLLAIRHILGDEEITEFVIDVNIRNRASARGITKGGFVLVAEITFVTLFSSWQCLHKSIVLDHTALPILPSSDHRWVAEPTKEDRQLDPTD